jgi:hypothetical protein
MAQVIEVGIKVDGSQSERALGTLKSQLREAQNEVSALSDKFGATSVQAVNAARKAAELKDRIGDAKALTDAFNPDAKFKALSASLGGVAGGFAAVQGGMNLLGVESSETSEALLKVQSAMALSQGAQAVGESVDSFRQLGTVIKSTTIFQQISTQAQRLWNLTMSANPIGAVVLAITALLTAGYALVNWYKSSSDETKKNTQAVSSNSNALDSQRKTADKTAIAIKKNGDYQIEMAKASGASAEAVRNLELKLIDEQIAFANSSRELAKNTYYKNKNALASLEAAGAEDELIAAQKETTQKALEEFGKQTKNLNDANAEKIQLIRNHNVEKKQAETNHNKEVGDEAKKAAETARQNEIEKQKKIEQERQELIGKQGEKAREEYEASEKLIADAKKANENSLKTENQIKVEEENAAFEAKKLDLLNKGLSIEEIEKEHKRKLAQLDNEYYAIESEKSIERDRIAKEKKDQADKEKLDSEMAIQNAIGSVVKSGNDLIGALQDAGIAKGKAGQVAMKALALVQIGLDTAQAFSTAVPMAIKAGKEAAAMAGPAAPFVGPIATATSYITSATMIGSNIMKAKKLLGGGGSAIPSSSANISSGSISTPASMAPNVNVVGASRTNAIAETIAQQGQQPIKAYVVANDVTTQQGLNRSIVTSASIG